MIKLENLNKKFNNVCAVDDVSLKINKGEIFGIIGQSGAGKSTLIRLINQLEKQDGGKVIFNDLELNKNNLQLERKKIGMIFQHFNLLWSRTVRKNIELPLELINMSKHQRKIRSEELIKLVGLEGKADTYPSELSGGQKQRVAIARALASNPEVILCDEATSALDPSTTDAILDLLAKINKEFNVTVVLITHQMEVVQKICHRVAIMHNGMIVEEGSVENIFKRPQNKVTKKLVQSLNYSGVALDESYLKQNYPSGKILRLTFAADISNSPILSLGIIKYQVKINIVNSNITHTQAGPLGVMYIHLTDNTNYQSFIDYLISKKVGVEVV